MALLYLIVIEFIVSTQPDHHAEGVPLVYYITLGSIFCGSATGTVPFYLAAKRRGSDWVSLCPCSMKQTSNMYKQGNSVQSLIFFPLLFPLPILCNVHKVLNLLSTHVYVHHCSSHMQVSCTQLCSLCIR